MGELLHLVGEERDTFELEHDQRAVRLVQAREASTQPRDVVVTRLRERLERLAGIGQGLVELVLYPIEGKDLSAFLRHSDRLS